MEVSVVVDVPEDVLVAAGLCVCRAELVEERLELADPVAVRVDVPVRLVVELELAVFELETVFVISPELVEVFDGGAVRVLEELCRLVRDGADETVGCNVGSDDRVEVEVFVDERLAVAVSVGSIFISTRARDPAYVTA